MATFKVRKYKDSVYIIYSHKNEIFKIFTGVKVEDRYWNIGSLKKNVPNYFSLQKLIDETMTRVMDAAMRIRANGVEPTATVVRMEYYKSLTPSKDHQPFWTKYKEYLDFHSCRESTRKQKWVAYHNLEYFCEFDGYTFDINTFDQVTFGKYVQYLLLHQKLADSTINRNVKQLKAFLIYAYPDHNFTFVKYELMNTDDHAIAMRESELRCLMEFPLEGGLDAVRDLFVFLATTGMRFSDSQLFHPSWVTEDQILEFSQLKTGGKAYPPLYEVSRSILSKYGGIPPQMTDQYFNRTIKEVFEECDLSRPVTTQIIKSRQVFRVVEPLYATASAHLARRSFISILLEKEVPLQDVMRMSGHSDFRSMKPYISINRKHIRMIADKWKI